MKSLNALTIALWVISASVAHAGAIATNSTPSCSATLPTFACCPVIVSVSYPIRRSGLVACLLKDSIKADELPPTLQNIINELGNPILSYPDLPIGIDCTTNLNSEFCTVENEYCCTQLLVVSL